MIQWQQRRREKNDNCKKKKVSIEQWNNNTLFVRYRCANILTSFERRENKSPPLRKSSMRYSLPFV